MLMARSSMLGVSPTLSDGVWAEHWNTDPKPFVWRTPAEEILAKVRRDRHTLNTNTNSASVGRGVTARPRRVKIGLTAGL